MDIYVALEFNAASQQHKKKMSVLFLFSFSSFYSVRTEQCISHDITVLTEPHIQSYSSSSLFLSMLLHEALLRTECPICLQPLNYTVLPPPSQPASPLYGTSKALGNAPSSPTSPGYASGISTATHSPITLPFSGNGATASREDEFHITFAPGVYGSDAADPWHPSFELTHQRDTNVPNRPTTTTTAGSRVTSSSTFSPEDYQSRAGKMVDQDGDTTATDESASGVAVLPCGHLLHYLCAMQLCEYTTHPSCPVCRTKLSSAAADLVLFCPRARAPPRTAATAVKDTRESFAAAQRKRRREGEMEAEEEKGRGCLDGESSNSVTVIQDDNVKRPGNVDEDILGDSERAPMEKAEPTSSAMSFDGEHSPGALPKLSGVAQPIHDSSLPTTTSAAENASNSCTQRSSASEEEILILGARQLPPSRAYAELLLRTTATWADRADVLQTRVTHLEKSQQQLQSDCAELDRTLASARRRRELLLNVPSTAAAATGAAGDADALPSFERLRELRRLCSETRTAMTESTAQLAASTREHAEVRRQIEKYTRKLARLHTGEEADEKEGTREHRETRDRHNAARRQGPPNSSGGAGGLQS